MFKWLTRKWARSDDGGLGLTEREAIEATVRLCALMEQHTLAVLDTLMLPLPKARMKLALKIAWQTITDEKLRAAIQGAYLYLANFHEGIGPDPIPLKIVRGIEKFEGRTSLGEKLLWQKTIATDLLALLEEFRQFKREQGVPDEEAPIGTPTRSPS